MCRCGPIQSSHLGLRRYKIHNIGGCSFDQRDTATTPPRKCATPTHIFQLTTILEENHHSFLIVEHDPLPYEDAEKMAEYVNPGPEAVLQMTKLDDRVFCIYGEQARG